MKRYIRIPDVAINDENIRFVLFHGHRVLWGILDPHTGMTESELFERIKSEAESATALRAAAYAGELKSVPLSQRPPYAPGLELEKYLGRRALITATLDAFVEHGLAQVTKE